jgi:hypothetical protein
MRWSRYLRAQLCNFLHIATVLQICRVPHRFGYLSCRFETSGIRGEMKLLDICIIGLVSIAFLGRFPSPLHSLRCDLISKNRLTALSAVCDLLALLVVCDYIASRFSPVGQRHPGWIAAEIVCLVALGLILGPAFRAFLLRFFAKNSSRTQPVKAHLSPR